MGRISKTGRMEKTFLNKDFLNKDVAGQRVSTSVCCTIGSVGKSDLKEGWAWVEAKLWKALMSHIWNLSYAKSLNV